MKKNLGFTLVELGIVISIFAILTTLGIASFVDYSRSQILQNDTYELVTMINFAKSRAFSQAKPDVCSTQSLDGYKVVVDEAGGSYELDVVCAGNIYKISEANFNQGVSVLPEETTSTSFYFPIMSGDVVGSGSLTLGAYNKKRTISVDSLGIIK